MKAYFDPCEICAARTGTHIMVGTMFGDVWICEQCAGEANAETPKSLEKAAPRAETPPLVLAQQGNHASTGQERAAVHTGTELSDEFFDDDHLEDEEVYPEPSPQTGFV